jgi:superfamily II DNA or RNA helicase
MNQIVQRIGRTLRKTTGKDTALIYTIYLSHTHDFSTLRLVRQATKVEDENNGPKISDSNLDRYVL